MMCSRLLRPRLWHCIPLFIFTFIVAYQLFIRGDGRFTQELENPENLKSNSEDHENCNSNVLSQSTDNEPNIFTSIPEWLKLGLPGCAINQSIEKICHKNASENWMKSVSSFHHADTPHDNYFYSDCNVAAHVVLTNSSYDSNLNGVASRLVVAWPAGNSGACLFFQSAQNPNSDLAITFVNTTEGSPLGPVYLPTEHLPSIGVKGVIKFGAVTNIPLVIAGSVRAIRDYTEGSGQLHPALQEKLRFTMHGTEYISISRLLLDNVTEMVVSFQRRSAGPIHLKDDKAVLEPGEYLFSARFNYHQLEQLKINDVLMPGGYHQTQDQEARALSFLSFSEKFLAGSWRFLTYFGRDDMISTLLLQPVLTNSAIEAVLGSVLERINRTDGSACHEEIIGDYATFLNMADGISSTEARCDYSMIDIDYFLPILMHAYFVESDAGHERLENLLLTSAGRVVVKNQGLTWGDLFTTLVNKIMRETASFTAPEGQKRENLIKLRDGYDTGVWRDSIYGLGGGRIPFDVNVALVPAALRSIARLAQRFGHKIFGDDWDELSSLAERYAQVWEDHTLEFFRVDIPVKVAQQRLDDFARSSDFYDGPSHSELVDADISYYAVALDGSNGLDMVSIMNTDACCRIFFLNGTNQPRLTHYLNATALSIIRPFPAGLRTPLGLVVANPAYSGVQELNQNFTNSAYHGTVIWSWQQVGMAKGLERQLDRCNSLHRPSFCNDKLVYNNVRTAYNVLWDNIEANQEYLSDEVWTWIYKDGSYHHAALSSLQPPPGVERPAESNVIQLWSLTFLAVKRNQELR